MVWLDDSGDVKMALFYQTMFRWSGFILGRCQMVWFSYSGDVEMVWF